MAKTCGVRVKFIRTAHRLKDFLAQPGHTFIQLHSPECAYCIEEAPHFVRASFEYCAAGQFARVDISELEETAMEDLKVEGIPLIMVFKDGTEVGRKEGLAKFEEISTFFDELL